MKTNITLETIEDYESLPEKRKEGIRKLIFAHLVIHGITSVMGDVRPQDHSTYAEIIDQVNDELPDLKYNLSETLTNKLTHEVALSMMEQLRPANFGVAGFSR